MGNVIIKYTVEGEILTIPVPEEGLTLHFLQEQVGEYIEHVLTSEGHVLVDEEGLFKGLPENPLGVKLFAMPLRGNIVRVNVGDEDFVPLTEEEAKSQIQSDKFALFVIDKLFGGK